jgi:thymidylate synthase
MKSYLNILQNILYNGVSKQPVRRDSEGNILDINQGTIALPNQFFSHDMSNGFPLLTCRKMPFRSAMVELEGFIKGITSKRWYEDRKCKYWRYWANPVKVAQKLKIEEELVKQHPNHIPFTRHDAQELEDDLGAAYPWMWRNFGRQYNDDKINGLSNGVDQIQYIVDTLKKDPYSRRMVCSAWNPVQLYLAALPSCHYSFVVNVIGDKINLMYTMRSCDFLLGHNIHTYGALLMLLAKVSGFTPGNLSGIYADCHIYNNQIDAAKELINRTPKPLPTVEIIGKDSFDLFKWTYKDITLINYESHPGLSIDVTI